MNSNAYFRLMDLPRELRDNVYRDLLLPMMVRGKSRPDGVKRFYAIHPAILRVSKQTYRESSRVLYEETKWVLVATSEDENGMITNMKRKTGYPFVDVQNPLCFPRTPVLRMRMDMSSLNDNDKYQAFMLVPHHDFQVIGKLLLLIHYTSIALRFDEDAMQIPAIREALLHCCRDFRGSHSVTIEGLNPPTECANLVNIMTTPIRRNEEYFERANTYQQRAANQVARGLFLEADGTNEAGAIYMRFAEGRRVGGNSPGSDSHSKANFTEVEVEFRIASAYCRTKAGFPKRSRILLDAILANNSKYPSPTKEQEVKIHYYKGLAFVAERDDVQALKEFRVVLSLEPGHEGADEQVDTMETRLHTMPQIKRSEVKAYLGDFVKPHRHREPGSAVLSENDMPVNGCCLVVIASLGITLCVGCGSTRNLARE